MTGLMGDRASLRLTLTSISLAVFCTIWIYPFLWMLSTSLKSNAEIFGNPGLIPQDWAFDNYVRAWVEARIGRYFFNTMAVTFGSVFLVTTSTAMLGYVLGRCRFPGRKTLLLGFVATVFIPQGFTIIPVFELLSFFGMSQSLVGLTLATSGQAMVIFVLLFAGYFNQMPKELEEAAVLDGVSFFRIFLHVMLPLARPMVVTVVIMQVLNAWNDFLLPLVVTIANPELRTLSVGIYAFQGEQFVDWSGMAAASTISIAPVVLLFLLLQRYFINGLAGAVKG
ncbi:carbohydrate ABC transporter permease [Phaeobacter inhibens]|uniref:carbohydrate ABC transporter permease n=1 Tax=Phaeobacter inhibens TaxID=221822 RepID=UPI0009F89E44|nr:carbohydrate ABC transporter permease [Phaeobacter inhibens]